jgi:hypothetical protein
LIFVSANPPKLIFELPTKNIKNTFVGFVLPNEKDKNDGKSGFFETLIEELKKNVEEKSFQEIFEAVKEKLKDQKVAIDRIDDFGQTPIYLFNKKRLEFFLAVYFINVKLPNLEPQPQGISNKV